MAAREKNTNICDIKQFPQCIRHLKPHHEAHMTIHHQTDCNGSLRKRKWLFFEREREKKVSSPFIHKVDEDHFQSCHSNVSRVTKSNIFKSLDKWPVYVFVC